MQTDDTARAWRGRIGAHVRDIGGVGAGRDRPGASAARSRRSTAPCCRSSRATASMLNVKVADDARVSALVKASLADIKADSFIGIAGMPQPDGSIKAYLGAHLPARAARRRARSAWTVGQPKPGSTMTNAYVANMVAGKDGETLTVKYKDGEKKVVVTPETVIAAAAPGSKRRAQGRSADHHLRLGEAGGRLGAGEGHVCRPRRHAGDVIHVEIRSRLCAPPIAGGAHAFWGRHDYEQDNWRLFVCAVLSVGAA